MIIEQNGVWFYLKSYAYFQNRTSGQRELDLQSRVKYDFRTKSHNTKLIYKN